VVGALAVLTLMHQWRLKGTAVVLRECSSAALLLFAACGRGVVTPYSTLLFHRMRWQSEKHIASAEAVHWARHFDETELSQGMSGVRCRVLRRARILRMGLVMLHRRSRTRCSPTQAPSVGPWLARLPRGLSKPNTTVSTPARFLKPLLVQDPGNKPWPEAGLTDQLSKLLRRHSGQVKTPQNTPDVAINRNAVQAKALPDEEVEALGIAFDFRHLLQFAVGFIARKMPEALAEFIEGRAPRLQAAVEGFGLIFLPVKAKRKGGHGVQAQGGQLGIPDSRQNLVLLANLAGNVPRPQAHHRQVFVSPGLHRKPKFVGIPNLPNHPDSVVSPRLFLVQRFRQERLFPDDRFEHDLNLTSPF
jgi:hypothetical protein